jgi:hypothetical protein
MELDLATSRELPFKAAAEGGAWGAVGEVGAAEGSWKRATRSETRREGVGGSGGIV